MHVRELNVADYGAGTSRKRLFLIARRDHEAVTFPEPTHLPANTPETLLGLTQPWVGAWQVIGFRRPTTSILNRAEPLAPNSNRRIAVGVLNLVLAHDDPFVIGGEVHVLLDIRTRMLEPTELKLAQGFPRDYLLTEGRDLKEVSKTRQIKLIGNSVPPPFAAAIARSLQRHLDHPASIRPLPAW